MIEATNYSFRCLAINDGGQSPGSGIDISTTQSLPATPGAPSFSGVDASQIIVTVPALPGGAESLTIQRKLANEANEAFINVAAGLAGGSANTVTGLASTTTYTFRVVAVNNGGFSFGVGANVTTTVIGASPGAPLAPTFTDVRATTLKVQAPVLPANTVQLKLQQKQSGEADSAYQEILDGLAGQSETLVSDLLPSTGYSFRFIAAGQNNGTTAGVAATVTTLGALPNQPGVPQFGAVTSTTAQIYSPSFPVGATSLSLFKKLKTEPNISFSLVASGIATGAIVSTSGLVAGTDYTFYFAAVNANGSTPGSPGYVTTAAAGGSAPAIPPTLILNSVEDNVVQFQGVSSPPTGTTFAVQRKYASEPDWAYRDIQNVLTNIPGLTPATAYTFRLIARSSTGQTPGSGTNVTTTGNSLAAPAAPHFSNVAPQSVVVLAPSLPMGATSLTLQRDNGNNTFINLATALAAGSSTTVTGLTASSSYRFRFVAVFPTLSVDGVSAWLYTPPSNVAAPSIPVLMAAFPDRVLIKSVSNRELSYKKAGESDYSYQSWGAERWTNQGLAIEFYDLTPNTIYNFRWRAANYDVFSPVLSVTTPSATQPLPGLPPAPSVGAVTTGAIALSIPSLPVHTLYLELEYQKGGVGAFIPDAPGGAKAFFAAATSYNFVPEPGQDYTLRWVAVGAGGRTIGPATLVTVPAGPGKPGVPVLVGVTNSSVTLTLPPLPANATSLRLYRPAYPNDLLLSINGSVVLAGGATVTVTGLQANTNYSFRCVAVDDSQNPGALTVGDSLYDVLTLPNSNAPAIPGTPGFSNIQSTQVTVTLPPLPDRAVSLILQKKAANDSSNFWSGDNIFTGLAGNSVVNVTGLTPAFSYRFRVVAVNAQGETAGSVAAVITDLPLPGLPSFSDITSGSVKVTAPPLPVGASLLTLHAKVSNQSDDTYERVSERLLGGEVTQITGLNRNTSYAFRYIAYSNYTTVVGPQASVTTLNASDVWASGPPISCQGIAWPQSGATLAKGSEGLLTAFLATDWDVRSSGATSNTLFSDTCNYAWTASAGQFKYGVASGQQVTWIAPTVSGSYVLTLTVKDQSSTNIGAAEIGSRHLDSGAADSPLTFNVTVTVP